MKSSINKVSIILMLLSVFGCKTKDDKIKNNIELKFLDEYILADNIIIDSTAVGGLSGIDFHNGLYYLVCDDSKNPRYYEATINIIDSEITSINIEKVIKVTDTSKFLDLESIRYNAKTKQVMLTNEGHINRRKESSFFSVNSYGKIDQDFNLPEAFKPNSNQKPRHNGTLEGLSKAFNDNGFWIAMELPFEADGPEPKLTKTKSPVRITFIDAATNEANNQFAYFLDPVAKQPKGNFLVNGLTDILEYSDNKFFVIERSYSSGLGNQSNTVKIFSVDATKASNTLNIDSLSINAFTSANKMLLLDFENLRDKLTNNSIDNIEGITFGPTLANGNKTLILVSDNNFNRFEKQMNQFILLEIID